MYDRFGRRDNKYKARIKILVRERTPEQFAADVEQERAQLAGGPSTVTAEEIGRIIGPAFSGEEAAPVARRLIACDL